MIKNIVSHTVKNAEHPVMTMIYFNVSIYIVEMLGDKPN